MWYMYFFQCFKALQNKVARQAMTMVVRGKQFNIRPIARDDLDAVLEVYLKLSLDLRKRRGPVKSALAPKR